MSYYQKFLNNRGKQKRNEIKRVRQEYENVF